MAYHAIILRMTLDVTKKYLNEQQIIIGDWKRF